MTCACESLTFDKNYKELLQQFKSCWSNCPALNQLLIPDWTAFEEADHSLMKSVATHRSMPLLAFQEGYLPRLTRVIHKYLMDGDAVKASVTANYRSDLRERWQQCDDPLERHRHSSMYLGKPMELFVAQDLESTGIAVVGLEATGQECDIVGVDNGQRLCVEVKFIGTENATFLAIEKSLTEGGIIGGFSEKPYTAHDYLISRLFEAAKKLEVVGGKRIAAAVIDDFMSGPFKYALKNLIELENASLHVLRSRNETTSR
jgi:hypothetical protein